MTGMTNRGKNRLLAYYYQRAGALPANFYVALITSATPPGPDTNTLANLTQIATGNGYTDGGIQLNPNSTDFPYFLEDDDNDKSIMRIRPLVWAASGGPLPSSGNGARYAVLTDDPATISARRVLVYWDLVSDRSLIDGATLTLRDLELQLTD